MPKLQSFLVLEATLVDKLVANYAKHIKIQSKKITKQLVAGDIAGAVKAANKINMSKSYKGLNKFLIHFKTMTMLFGSSRLTPLKETEIYKTKKVPEEGALIVTQLKSMIDSSTESVKATAFKLIDDFEQESKGIDAVKIEKAAILIDDIVEDSLLSGGTNKLNIAASLQSSRLAGMGYVYEAEVIGVTTYRVSEQLDRRTCPVCKIMHGKEFSVSDARTKLNAAIRTDEPADLKVLAPWPKQDAKSLQSLQEMSTSDLVGANFQTPPYHPMCRGQLVASTDVVELSGTTLINEIPKVKPDVQEQIIDNVIDSLEVQAALTQSRLGLVPDNRQSEISSFVDANYLKGSGEAAEAVKRGVGAGLSEAEAKVLTGYTGSLYRPLNKHIRGVDPEVPIAEIALFNDTEKLLNNAIGKLPKHSGDVIRQLDIPGDSISLENLVTKFGLGTKHTGANNGFLSTSYGLSDFQTSRLSDESTIVDITIHNSTTGANVTKFSRFGTEEKEVIIPTTTSLKVTDVEVVASSVVGGGNRLIVSMVEELLL